MDASASRIGSVAARRLRRCEARWVEPPPGPSRELWPTSGVLRRSRWQCCRARRVSPQPLPVASVSQELDGRRGVSRVVALTCHLSRTPQICGAALHDPTGPRLRTSRQTRARHPQSGDGRPVLARDDLAQLDRHPGTSATRVPAEPEQPGRSAPLHARHRRRGDLGDARPAVDVDDPVRPQEPAGVLLPRGEAPDVRQEGDQGGRAHRPPRAVARPAGRQEGRRRRLHHRLRRGPRQDPGDRDRRDGDQGQAPHLDPGRRSVRRGEGTGRRARLLLHPPAQLQRRQGGQHQPRPVDRQG